MDKHAKPRLILTALFVCFFLSGSAALLYEVVWMRMLTQIFGSSAYAVATVLAAFMAGLALGSYVFGRFVNSERNCLRLYGILELGIGIYGLLVPYLFKTARGIYLPLFWLYDSYPAIFTCLLFVFSFVLLVFPTFLMGATLPVLSRFFVRSFSHLGQRVGDLYGTNTLGAVLGCALTGYYLIPTMGMNRTVHLAAMTNLAVALVIFLIDGKNKQEAAEPLLPSGSTEPQGKGQPRSKMELLLLLSIALSGAAAMIYENAWTHALTLVIGGSIYSFTTMLLTFLTGLAAGGYLYARCFGKRGVRIVTFGWIELAVGIAGLATIPLFEKLPLLFLRFHQGFGDTFSLFLTIQVLLSFTVMFLPTMLLGMTFPLVVCLFTQSIYRVGSSVGTTYACNTVGAILGAVAGGFVFLPLFGMQGSIIIGALLNLFVGWLLLIADPHPGRSFRLLTGGTVAVALALLALRFPFWDRDILTSGVTVYANSYAALPTDSLRLEEMRKDKLLYYREGLTATISVHQARKDYRYLKTNGKVDGSHGDALTMLMTGYLPMLLNPRAEQVAVIGLGTGMTIKAVGTFPVKKIDVLEIEPAMAEAAAFFPDLNGKILEDPRVRLIPTDGRNYIMATPHLYDLIISEPSNPWIAGVAGLFTKEFYAVAKQKLKPNGILAQWIHNYSMSPNDFRMVLRTFGESFPHVTVWNLQESDFLLIGSLQEQNFDYPLLRHLPAKNPTLEEDFKERGLSDIYSVLGFYRMGRQELLQFAGGADQNTDDNALLEFSAPRSLGKSTTDLNRMLLEPFMTEPPWRFNPHWVSRAQHHYYLSQAYYASGWHERALEEIELAIKLEPRDGALHLLRAQILIAQDNASEAAQAAEKALAYEPERVKRVLAIAEDLYTNQARPIYLRIVGLGAKEIVPYLGLGGIALRQKQFVEAERWLLQAKKLQPDHPAVLLALGRLELAKGNYAEARTLLEASREKGEDSATLYSELGEALSQLKQWEKAASSFEQALKRHRLNTKWRLAQARALGQLGRVRDAEIKYREVLAIDPSSSEAWQGLKYLGIRY